MKIKIKIPWPSFEESNPIELTPLLMPEVATFLFPVEIEQISKRLTKPFQYVNEEVYGSPPV